MHWSLVLVNLKNKTMEYIDSRKNDIYGYNTMKKLAVFFDEYLLVNLKFELSERNTKQKTIINNNLNKEMDGDPSLDQTVSSADDDEDIECDTLKKSWEYSIGLSPKQFNHYDCGIFLCKNMDYIMRSSPMDYEQEDILFFRYLIGIELMKGQILTTSNIQARIF